MQPEHLKELIKTAIPHKGASFIEVLQPCVTYNNVYTAKFYSEKVYKLEEEGWNPIVKNLSEINEKLSSSFKKAIEPDNKIPIGVFYRNPYASTFEDRFEERLQSYKNFPPAKQSISIDGKPILTDEDFKILFSKYIVKVKKGLKT